MELLCACRAKHKNDNGPNVNQGHMSMKTIKNYLLAAALFASSTLFAGDAETLIGKWSTKKTNEDGDKVTQTMEIKKDKFIFQVLKSDNTVALYATGDFKTEKLGPFNSARFSHIRGGPNSSDLNDVDDEYVCIYTLDGDTWTMATNFDKEREKKPAIDVYTRSKAKEEKSASAASNQAIAAKN